MAPASTAVIPFAVLRHGHDSIADDVLALLNDPLLLSYGSLGPALKAKADAGHPRAEALRALAARNEASHAAASAASSLVELRPSEAHCEIERSRWNEDMERSIRAAYASSVLASLMTTQHLLYGRRSAFYAEAPKGGEARKVEVQMARHSVGMELPLLGILDPIGLAITLLNLKLGEVAAT